MTRTDVPGAEDEEPGAAVGRTMALVQRFKAGDRAALDELFQRYYERVRRIIRIQRGAKVRSKETTDDLVQNTFVAAVGAFERFEMKEPAAFVRWITQVARNQVRDAADRWNADCRDPVRDRSLGGSQTTTSSGFATLPGEEPSPSEAITLEEEKEIVDQCVADLPEEHREVIVLREYEGGSWDYVAESLGRSVGAVQMLHLRAREKLGELLSKRLGTPGE